MVIHGFLTEIQDGAQLATFDVYIPIHRSQDSSGGTVTRLSAGYPRNQGSITGKDKIISLLRNVQISSGALPASYTVSTRGCFPGVKAAGA
jgi:hypothetical protein